MKAVRNSRGIFNFFDERTKLKGSREPIIHFVSVIYLGCDFKIKLPSNLKLLLIYDVFDVERMKNTL